MPMTKAGGKRSLANPVGWGSASPGLISLLGLGFGDCGKGMFTDAMCRRTGAWLVVRFNGGAQAGHNVVLPDGTHHTFSQFGSGTFVPGVMTLLAQPVIVHPTALLVEAQYLQSKGVSDPLSRLWIDERCRVTTPFHQAAGRLREWRRGALAHGTCGVGVGETVKHALEHPEQTLHYADLMNPSLARDKLECIRVTLGNEFRDLDLDGLANNPCRVELELLRDATVSQTWLEQALRLVARVRPASRAFLSEQINQGGTIIFEGAQGVLLDEWYGFHPHTTWSSISTRAVMSVAHDLGYVGEAQHFGLLRSYATRHGAGPLPTHDAVLDALAEPHNASEGWQGHFRRGHFDAVLLRYALAVVGPLEGLMVSHLDVLDRQAPIQWCSAYQDTSGHIINALAVNQAPCLEHQSALTELLQSVRPVYELGFLNSTEQLISAIATVSSLPVVLGSYGPTHHDVRVMSLGSMYR